MVGLWSHSVCNNDELRGVQAELNELERALDLVRRNDTRWASQHAMLKRVLRLYNAICEYFRRHLSIRALFPMEWQAVRELVSVLDDPALVSTQIQGGRHAFVGQAINDFSTLLSSLADTTQEIRSLDPWDGPKEEVAVSSLREEVRTVLTELVKDMKKRGLGSAMSEPERINVVLDPRFKSCCDAVCSNGGPLLQEQVRTEVMGQFSTFIGDVPATSTAQSVGTTSPARGGGGREGAAAAEALAPAPTAPLSRLERIRAEKNKLVARPNDGPNDGLLARTDAGVREFGEYMAEAACTNNTDFDLLEYWKMRAIDGLDASGKVVVPARWPHVGLVARLYAGIDTTSCQAERNFSALKLAVSDLRSTLGSSKVEKILFLRLNRGLVPGLGKTVKGLEALKAEQDAAAETAFAAKTAVAGDAV